MAILPIYLYGTEVLKKPARPVEAVTDELVKLIMNMFDTMRNAQGIGLAANQVGRLERVLVIDVSEMEEMKDIPPLTIINPEVLSRDGTLTIEEGCLSIPDVRAEVERAEHIRLRYRDTSFRECELEAGGMLARVILHEIDHLDGVLFIDHLSDAGKHQLKDELKAIKRGEIEPEYPVFPPPAKVSA